jgi:hypothetical protein
VSLTYCYLRSGSGGCLLRGAKYEVDDGFILVGGK